MNFPEIQRFALAVVQATRPHHALNFRKIPSALLKLEMVLLIQLDSEEVQESAKIVVAVVFDLNLPFFFCVVEGNVGGKVIAEKILNVGEVWVGL